MKDKMKEIYEAPSMEVIEFENEDIITSSGIDEGDADLSMS